MMKRPGARSPTMAGFAAATSAGWKATAASRSKPGWATCCGSAVISSRSPEIEDYVRRFPGIAACEAVGAVGEGGLVAVAFVTLSPGAALDEAALRQFCAAGLARFKVPARCVALDAFPTTTSANGTKVQRARLREMAERLLAGRELPTR